MKPRSSIVALLISLLALLNLQFSYYLPAVHNQSCLAVEHGLAFLKARYNPALGLLNEAPIAAPHIYWLTNDNALAAYAFDQLGQAELGAALHATLRSLSAETNGLIEVLWGLPVAFPPFDRSDKEFPPIGQELIKQELHTGGNLMPDWAEYANLAFLDALNEFQQGHPAEAQTRFAAALALYDGTGFNDKAFKDPRSNSRYETYKLALALYVGAAIQAPNPQADVLRAALLAMQTPAGGFATHYLASRQIAGDANTETSSLALLALKPGCR